MRQLTAGRMMRPDVVTISDTMTIAEFRRRFPLGAATRVIVVDDAQRYAGIVQTAAAYAEGRAAGAPVGTLASGREVCLPPDANIQRGHGGL